MFDSVRHIHIQLTDAFLAWNFYVVHVKKKVLINIYRIIIQTKPYSYAEKIRSGSVEHSQLILIIISLASWICLLIIYLTFTLLIQMHV